MPLSLRIGKINGILLLLTELATAGEIIPAPYEIQKPDFKTYSFENGVPEEFTSEKGSVLSIDKSIFKGGGASLRWTWDRPNAVISFKNSAAFQNLTGKNPDTVVFEWVTFTTLSALNFWIYNEKAENGELFIEIGEGQNTDSRFSMKLNFSGWREFQALYGRDMPSFPSARADTLRFIAPAGSSSGTLWIDLFNPRIERDVRVVRATEQTPWVFKGAMVEHSPRSEDRDRFRAFTPEVPAKLTAEQLSMISHLTDAVLAKYRPAPGKNSTPVSAEEMQKLRSAHEARQLVRSENDSISIKDISTVGNAGNRAYWRDVNQVIDVWLRSDNQPEIKAELEAILADLVDLAIQHGQGAGYPTRDSFGGPILKMKEFLVRTSRFVPLIEKLRQQNSLSDLYLLYPEADADVYNTLSAARLFLIFAQDDPVAKHRDLLALRHWLDKTAQTGGIKADGSFFHHWQTYSGYNIAAMTPLAAFSELLHGTEYYSHANHIAARRAALAMNFYSCNGNVPHILGGRWRGEADFRGVGRNIFRMLAESGNPDTGEALDLEMAAIHLYYCDLSGKDDAYAKKYRELGIKPWTANGHLSLNYTVAGIHRRDNWMVMFRGQRTLFVSFEAYSVQSANSMGRYLNYGHMSIISSGNPPSEVESGFNPPKVQAYTAADYAGWNFNFWPGTTVRELPFEALRSHFDVEETVTSETFAAGTSLDGNGVFAMKLREDLPGSSDPKRIGPTKYWLGEAEYNRRVKDSRYDPTFRANKSVFFFDNRILCLGSDIYSEDTTTPVKTTLFQRSLSEADKQRLKFPDEQQLAAGKNGFWIDRNGDGYYIAPGNDAAELSRAHRNLSYHPFWITKGTLSGQEGTVDAIRHNTIAVNSGATELAVLNHGNAPKNKEYEYCLVMRTDENGMKDFAAKMADPQTAYYRVLAKDRNMHIVQDVPSKTTAYALFNACPELPDVQYLLAADRPCLVMIKTQADNHIKFSVYDPELTGSEYTGGADKSSINLAFKGRWQVANAGKSASSHVKNNTTVIAVVCDKSGPTIVALVPEK